MWIKLTPYCKNNTILVNTDNVTCVSAGQENGEYEGITLVYFTGNDDNFITVEETVEEIEQLILFGLNCYEN